MEKIKIKKLTEFAKIPEKATDGSAAFDIFFQETGESILIPRGRCVLKLGFAMEIPSGYCAKIVGRSGNESKGFAGSYTSSLDNIGRFDCDVEFGLIDSDYRGEVGVILNNHEKPFFIDSSQRIAQMIIEKVEDAEFEEVEELSDTDRGEGGFGHTGN